MNRRSLLLATAAALGSGRLCAGDAPRGVAADEDPANVEKVRDLFRQAKVGALRASHTEHYTASGDVPAEDRLRVARYCERLRSATLDYFTRAGFAPTAPAVRLSLVVIGDPAKFDRLRRVLGVSALTQGFYNTKTRVFVVPLIREGGNPGRPVDWQFTLREAGHEALHQLHYHSGLLNPSGDVPDCIGEGLAMLSDPDPGFAPSLLKPPPERVAMLGARVTGGRIPCEDLFRTDGGPQIPGASDAVNSWSLLASYAHAWLLISTVLADDALRGRLRAYLKAIAPRMDGLHRVADAREHLGDLKALDARMDKHLARLMTRPTSRYKSVRR